MFREDKTTQAACYLLKLAKRPIKYYQMLKMLYIADRTKIIETAMPITFDKMVNMKDGPLLSQTYDLVKGTKVSETAYWSKFIKTEGQLLSLTEDPGDDELSPLDERILKKTFEEWGHKSWSQFKRDSHAFPEWYDPGTGVAFVSYEEFLTKNNASQSLIDQIKENVAVHDSNRNAGSPAR